jgi:ribosomal-protein-alanine N-acetyltransferase
VKWLATSTYKIMRFKEENLEDVISINRLCLPENYSGTFFLDIHRSSPESFIVAKHNGKVVGYTMCRIEWGFSELQKIKVVRKGHIISIAVLPDHRMRKIATALMKTVLKALSSNKCNETFLEVRTSNQQAISLYKKLGYSPVKKISGYYCDGEEALVMGRTLPISPEECNPIEGITNCAQNESKHSKS